MAPSLSLSKHSPVSAPAPPPPLSSSSSSSSSSPRSPFRTIHFPAVVVTGASSGIGAATAAELAHRGFFVFGCVRRAGDAARLAGELGPTRFCAVEMDVCDEASVRRAADFVGEALLEGTEGEGWEGEGEGGGCKKKRNGNDDDDDDDDDEGSVIAALGGSGGSRDFRRLLRADDEGENNDKSASSRRKRKRAASGRALLAGLVNCAGVAIPGPTLHQPLSEVRRHLEVNYVGATCVTQAFAALLGAGRGERVVVVDEEEEEEEEEEGQETAAVAVDVGDRNKNKKEKKKNRNEKSVDNSDNEAPSPPPSSSATRTTRATKTIASRFAASSFPVSNPGTIVQVSSTAGKLSAPFIGAYAASKHALEATSDSLRREIHHAFGVDVAVVEPGAVATPIWDKAERHELEAESFYDGTPYKRPLKVFGEIVRAEGRSGHSPERIAKIVAGIFEKRQRQKQQQKEKSLVSAVLSLPLALTSSSIPTRTTCVYKRVRNWTLPHLLPDRTSDFVVAAVLGMTPGAFFAAEIEERRLAAEAGEEETDEREEKKKEEKEGEEKIADVGGGGGKGKEGKKKKSELAVARRVVAAVALVAAVISFAARVIVS